MEEITVSEFVRNLKTVIDRIARIVTGSAHLTAIEAMGDLNRTLPEDAAKDWLADSRKDIPGLDLLAFGARPAKR